MYYFAHGINLDESELFMKCPEARFVGAGLLEYHKVIINKYGEAALIRQDDSSVRGTVWEISDAEARILDEYENVPENINSREKVPVMVGGITLQDVLVYVAVNPIPGVAKKEFVEQIVKAANEYGFPDEYIEYLKSLPTG